MDICQIAKQSSYTKQNLSIETMVEYERHTGKANTSERMILWKKIDWQCKIRGVFRTLSNI